MIEQKELSRWFFSSQEDDDESEFPAEFNANALKKTQVPLTRSQGI
jgi:hypothetical protein